MSTQHKEGFVHSCVAPVKMVASEVLGDLIDEIVEQKDDVT